MDLEVVGRDPGDPFGLSVNDPVLLSRRNREAVGEVFSQALEPCGGLHRGIENRRKVDPCV
jgi:hypothetical protein